MAVTTRLPRAMLIDMDDTILSAYGRPEIAWHHIAGEFAGELAPVLPQQAAAAVLTLPIGWISERFGRKKLFVVCAAGFTREPAPRWTRSYRCGGDRLFVRVVAGANQGT